MYDLYERSQTWANREEWKKNFELNLWAGDSKEKWVQTQEEQRFI